MTCQVGPYLVSSRVCSYKIYIMHTCEVVRPRRMAFVARQTTEESTHLNIFRNVLAWQWLVELFCSKGLHIVLKGSKTNRPTNHHGCLWLDLPFNTAPRSTHTLRTNMSCSSMSHTIPSVFLPTCDILNLGFLSWNQIQATQIWDS